jgi:hypothetical protein
LGVKRFPDEVMEHLSGINSKLLHDYLNSERDTGINELRRQILRECNGGISVTVELNRGICNLNNEADAASKVPNIWTPEARALVEPTLIEIHTSILKDIDSVLAAIGEKTPIVCLHSMDPWGFKPGVRPKLSPATFEQYVRAQGLPADKKKVRKEDFITGKENGPVIADANFYTFMKEYFDQHGIIWGDNDPYDTEDGYPDFRYMQQFPGRVSAIDLTKTRLCRGDFDTFDYRNPVADQEKIEFMAELHRGAINARVTST